MIREIVAAGAYARTQGKLERDNPYLAPEGMPGKTGEPVDLWMEKAVSWNRGWKIAGILLAVHCIT